MERLGEGKLEHLSLSICSFMGKVYSIEDGLLMYDRAERNYN